MNIKDEKTKQILLDFAVLVINIVNNKAIPKHDAYNSIDKMIQTNFEVTTTTTLELK